jgi:integrase
MKARPLQRLPVDQAIAYYLALRRQLGFALACEGGQLTALGRYARAHHHRGALTTGLVVRWAQAAPNAGPRQQARRFEIARRFAQFWRTINPATEVPPAGWLGPSGSQRQANLYEAEQIQELLAAARQLPGPPWRALTYYTLFGLLACTGLRLSEALGLQRHEVDWKQHQLLIRNAKSGQARYLVLHPSAWSALRHYARQRPKAGLTGPFFSQISGAPLVGGTVRDVFAQLQRRLGWPPPRRRLHDLRHTFAVNTLLTSYRQGQQGDQQLLALSAYLGHAAPQNTYWYLGAIPKLMALVCARW